MRAALAASLAALVSACSSHPRSQSAVGRSDLDPRYGVRASPRVIAEGEPVPKGGGRDMVGKPYMVAGRTYVPRENPRYARVGLASWYGAAFHGRLTANGEVFDKESIAAAHPTMPLPSYARVTNLRNGRSLIVRVNDRGPYHDDRIIDVSQRAAEALDFERGGTSRVRVEYVGRAPIQGSDDRRLIATLRTDGRPAPFDGRIAPTLVASAEPGSPSRPAGRPDPVPAEEGSGRSPERQLAISEPQGGGRDATAAASTPLPPLRPGAAGSAPPQVPARMASRELPPRALSYASVRPDLSDEDE